METQALAIQDAIEEIPVDTRKISGVPMKLQAKWIAFGLAVNLEKLAGCLGTKVENLINGEGEDDDTD